MVVRPIDNRRAASSTVSSSVRVFPEEPALVGCPVVGDFTGGFLFRLLHVALRVLVGK